MTPTFAPLVVICPDCRRPMNGTSCTRDWAKPWEWPGEPHETHRCLDCATPVGGLHHHHCHNAMCATCGEQLLMCEHLPDSWEVIPDVVYHFGG